jgi:hypothetical protein
MARQLRGPGLHLVTQFNPKVEIVEQEGFSGVWLMWVSDDCILSPSPHNLNVVTVAAMIEKHSFCPRRPPENSCWIEQSISMLLCALQCSLFYNGSFFFSSFASASAPIIAGKYTSVSRSFHRSGLD